MPRSELPPARKRRGAMPRKPPELAAVEGEILLHASRHRADGAGQAGEKRQPKKTRMLAQRLENALDHLPVAEGLAAAEVEAAARRGGEIERRQSGSRQIIGMDRLAQPLAGARPEESNASGG